MAKTLLTIYMSMCIYVYICTLTFEYIHIFMYVCMFVCVYVCMCIYKYYGCVYLPLYVWFLLVTFVTYLHLSNVF